MGRSPFGEPGDWTDVWVAMVHCFGATYLPAAWLATGRSGRTSAADLEAQFGTVTGGTTAWLRSSGATAPWIAAGAAGVLLTLLGPWLTEPAAGGPVFFWLPRNWSPESAWHRVLVSGSAPGWAGSAWRSCASHAACHGSRGRSPNSIRSMRPPCDPSCGTR